MKTLAEYQDDVPTWALCSIYNGDDSGLEDEEIEQVNRWCKQWQDKAAELGGHVVYSTEKDDDGNDITDEFNHNPAFGLACSTESTVILILGPYDEQ
jgi:hypothetical protein